MASPKGTSFDIDLATSNTSCRILIVSSSLEHARALISRIQALGKGSAPISATDDHKQDLLSPNLIKIPWTIENKYYSADVHFAAHPIRGLAPYLLQNVPAVIFVWGSSEGYRHHIERISSDLGGHEPEVSLAVRMKPLVDKALGEDAEEEEESGEDNASIDAFVSSFGFEYVDATQDSSDKPDEGQDEEENEFDVIPGLPRVLDALSTIMWPSMKAQERVSKHTSVRIQRDPSLFEWGTEAEDNSSSLVDDLVANSSIQLSARAKRIQSEMEELTRWLEQDTPNEDVDDPWKMAAGSSAMVSSPTDISVFHDRMSSASRSEDREPSSLPVGPAGFDDDFTVFVSAPAIEAEVSGKSSSHRSPKAEMEEEGLKPWRGLSSYNSLGSVSDFGEADGGRKAPDVTSDDEDEDLPTREEIMEASSRIFGSKDGQRTFEASQGVQDGEHDTRSGGAEYETSPFDLSQVLGALQQMKEEISEIENEDERRRAAARVALGLVYGLEVNNVEGDFK